MDQTRQKEIASKGGKAAHRSGHAHQFTRDEARAAGRKGGEAVSSNREHMREIGKKGGQASGGRRRKGREEQVSATPQQEQRRPEQSPSGATQPESSQERVDSAAREGIE